MEQLNIVGKRSGDGFVAHKAMLVTALSRVMAERIEIANTTIGRKGFIGYIKALAGSNILKVVPANGSASETQAVAKKLKVICGSNTSYLEDLAWVGDKTSMTFAEIRVSPHTTVKPNIGSTELAEALDRVLPFTCTEDNRPVLQCVLFVAGEGKLKLASADGFRLAEVILDYDGDEGRVLIHRDELKGIAGALRKAKRVCVGFERSGDTLDGMSLIIDTEAIRYKWRGTDGQFPDYEKLIPTEHNTVAHLDTVEAGKAISSQKILADSKTFAIDLHIAENSLTMANTEAKGETALKADTEGNPVSIRVDGGYVADVLKACGGMVDLKLTNAYSPLLFVCEGYQVVVMPMSSSASIEAQKRDNEAKAQAEPEAQAEGIAEVIAEAEAVLEAEAIAETEMETDWQSEAEMEAIAEFEAQAEAEAELEAEAKKPKRSRKRDKVAVA